MKRQTILLLLSVLLLSGGAAAAEHQRTDPRRPQPHGGALLLLREPPPRSADAPRPKATNPSTSATTAATARVGTPRRASTKIRAQSSARRPKQVNSRRWAKMPCAASKGRRRRRPPPLRRPLAARRCANTAASPNGCTAPSPKSFRRRTAACAHIRARSTLVPRCMLSMAAANERLKS